MILFYLKIDNDQEMINLRVSNCVFVLIFNVKIFIAFLFQYQIQWKQIEQNTQNINFSTMSSSYSHLPSNLNHSNYTNPSTLTPRNNIKLNNDLSFSMKNTNTIQSQLKSPRLQTNHSYGQINNQLYTQSNKPVINPNSSIKLNQMSSDLAKLKQQLSKIMSQADKFDKKNLNSSQSQQSHLKISNNPITSQNETYSQSRNIQTFNSKNTSNPVFSQRKQIIYQNIQNQIKQQQKLSNSISISKDYSLSYLPQYQKKSPKIESYQSQKNLNYNSKNYFSEKLNQSSTPQLFVQTIPLKQQKKFFIIEEKTQEIKPKLKIKGQFQAENPISSKRSTIQQTRALSSYEPMLFKKPSSSLSHELIVSQIVNEELSKKIESNFQAQHLRKKKQEDQLQYQQKIIQLEHQKRKIKHQLINIQLEKQNLQVQLKNQKSQKDSILKKYYQLQQTLKANKFQLQEYKTKCKLLQKKMQSEISRPKTTPKNQSLTFDESLKNQLIEIKKYKDKLEQKDQEILKLKDLNTTHRREIQSLHNQIKIQQLKAASQVNQCDLKNSILIQDKQNQIKTFKNLIITLQAKLQVAVKQNKSKDAFMVQHLTGKVKTQDEKQYIETFFKNYEIQFPTNKISQKIKEQQAEIQRLKKTILQMAAIKK